MPRRAASLSASRGGHRGMGGGAARRPGLGPTVLWLALGVPLAALSGCGGGSEGPFGTGLGGAGVGQDDTGFGAGGGPDAGGGDGGGDPPGPPQRPPDDFGPFEITLYWEPPAVDADGDPLLDLAGYRIYDGPASRDYTMMTDVGNVTAFTLESLPAGIRYITITAYDTSENESAYYLPELVVFLE